MFHRRPPCRFRVLGLLLSVLVTAGSGRVRLEAADPLPEIDSATEKASVEALAQALVLEFQRRSLEEVWEAVNRLVRLGRRHNELVGRELQRALRSGEEKVRLAAARALSQLNEADRAGPVLLALVLDSKDPEIRKAAVNAIALSPLLADDQDTPQALRRALERESDLQARIVLGRTLWRIGHRSLGKQTLVELMRKAAEKDVRDEAALVLAEMGLLVPMSEWEEEGGGEDQLKRDVYRNILNLSLEPTARGERAFNLYRRMEAAPKDMGEKMAKGLQLMREILLQVQMSYPDQDKIDLEDLFEHAGKGLVEGLDPFSQYMDREEVRETQELLRQDYGGIGAYIGIRSAVVNGAEGQYFRVISPIYNAPAFKAGLRSMDTILEVDGEKATGMLEKGGMSRIIGKLKGEPGTPVLVKYFRRGFHKPVEARIIRDSVQVVTVLHELLPAGIGYIRVRRFGERTCQELDLALKDLCKQQKAKGIVLDLRDNPGGLLRSGVEVADRFLSENRLIVYSMGRESAAPRKDYYATGDAGDEQFPLVVLVNGGAASASEIVAGALQDHKRAILVGEKTYGKGSVQQLIPLRATQNQTQLRLTIAKYYLPSGVCIHEKGIQPDLLAAEPESDDWTVRMLYKLRQDETVEEYVRRNWAESKPLFLQLAESDEGRAADYPAFDPLLKKAEELRLTPDDLRGEVRRVLRRMAEDERAREFACDLQTDTVLQSGVCQMLQRLEIDPATVAQYKRFAGRFQAKTAAREPEQPWTGPEGQAPAR